MWIWAAVRRKRLMSCIKRRSHCLGKQHTIFIQPSSSERATDLPIDQSAWSSGGGVTRVGKWRQRAPPFQTERQTPSFRQLFSFNQINSVSGANKSLFCVIQYMNLNLFQFSWKKNFSWDFCVKTKWKDRWRKMSTGVVATNCPPGLGRQGGGGGGILKLAASEEQDGLAEGATAGTLRQRPLHLDYTWGSPGATQLHGTVVTWLHTTNKRKMSASMWEQNAEHFTCKRFTKNIHNFLDTSVHIIVFKWSTVFTYVITKQTKLIFFYLIMTETLA